MTPFSAGSAAELYEALQYSGLVTPDMTFDEMCAALSAYWPAKLYLYQNGKDYYNLTKHNDNNNSAITKGTNSMTYTCTSSANLSSADAYFDSKFNLEGFSKLHIKYSLVIGSGVTANIYNSASVLISEDMQTKNKEYSFNGNQGKGTVEATFDISNVNNNAYIGFYVCANTNNTKVTTTLTIYELWLEA